MRAVGLVAALAAALAGFGVLPGETGATNGASPKISPQVLSDTASGGETQFVVYLGDQADLSAAYAMRDQDARGWYVYRTLREHAARTQAPVIAQLEAAGVPYRSFWAANVVMTAGDRSLVDTLAARADVKAIESDDKSDWIQNVEAPFDFDSVTALVAAVSPQRPAAPDTIEWGVNDVHAPALWSAGYTGQGMVVASADTGVRWTHTRAQEPVPRLERHKCRPQLQLARRGPRRRRLLWPGQRPAVRRRQPRNAHDRHHGGQ